MSTLANRFGAGLAGKYFAARELNDVLPSLFGSVDRFWESLISEQQHESSDQNLRAELRKYIGNDTILFRGQSNHGYGLSSSLHRFVQAEIAQVLSEKALADVETSILREAEERGLKKNVSPGELLMILQHHHAPTRLLDVSVKPLEALYFAVEKGDRIDGRLFMLWLQNSEGLELSNTDKLPWTEHVRGQTMSASTWTQTVRIVEERLLDPRMIAQQGRFLVGGLNRAYHNLNMWHEDKQLRITERTAISTYCINFPKVNLQQMQAKNSAWPALGWTVRIPASWKPELRVRLESIGINHDSIYPDLGNVQWRAEAAARNSRA